MKTANRVTADLQRDYAKLINAAHVKWLKSLGLDIVEANRDGAYVTDLDGKRYLDCYSNAGIFPRGRRQADVRAELRTAMRETDQGNFPMISREKARLASALAEFVGGELECTVYSVMRGESFDFACKLARGFTGRPKLVAVDGSWFGETGFALSLSTRDDKNDFAPLVPQTQIIPFGDADAARAAIDDQTACVLLEPLQTENGCREASPEYLRTLRQICHAAGALLALDETQTGLGRTGVKFAYQRADVAPDILLIGEALGAGVFPIAATIFTQRLNAFMNAHPLIHLSTFGGSDLGCRVGAKALAVYAERKPWENAARLGARLQAELSALTGGALRAVHGRGLLWALEFKTPVQAVRANKLLAANGVLAVPGAVAKNTVVLRPSLLLTDRDVDALLRAVKMTLAEMKPKARAKK